MQIHTLLRIGAFHTNHCEDYIFTGKTGKDRLLIAVMDGCTMGSESHFAANLCGKLLRKIAIQLEYENLKNQSPALKQELQHIMERLMQELAAAKNQLSLEREEMLHTLIIGIVDASTGNAELLVVGDGLVAINEDVFVFDQDDKPDYLGYHIGSNFEEWYRSQKQFLSAVHFNRLSIATDGIFTFRNFAAKTETPLDEIYRELLFDETDRKFPKMLENKLAQLNRSKDWVNGDDLAIVRLSGF